MARTTTIPRSAIASILLDAGAPRVSRGAVDVLLEEIENRAVEIGKKAVRAAQHAGRKTVVDKDVRMAH